MSYTCSAFVFNLHMKICNQPATQFYLVRGNIVSRCALHGSFLSSVNSHKFCYGTYEEAQAELLKRSL